VFGEFSENFQGMVAILEQKSFPFQEELKELFANLHNEDFVSLFGDLPQIDGETPDLLVVD
jgi:hypothetical protein